MILSVSLPFFRLLAADYFWGLFLARRDSVTKPVNIGPNALFEP
jgi:hypothetical protein